MKLNLDDVAVTSFSTSDGLGEDGLMADINTRSCPQPIYTRDGANTCYCSNAVGCGTNGMYAC
ncbi:hypothetical protein [Longimicrobium sp.]|uniref:hypothetical protein n=1 Tax=Longimicrobium sp. TaxID=2029185 RepID=UPI003B3B6489